MQAIFKRETAPKADLLYNLSQVAAQTGIAWRMSATQIAERHTLLPYFASYLPRERRQAVLNAAVGTGNPTSYALLGHSTAAVKRVPKLRFCPKCITEDRQRVGEGYWRRTHQLPGVFACIKHNVPLRVSNVSVDCDRRKVIWTTVEHAFEERDSHMLDITETWLKDDSLMKVMKSSVSLLYEPPSEYGKTSSENYLARAKQAGFSNKGRRLNQEALNASITESFNTEYLERVGLSKTGWPIRMLTCNAKRQLFQPLEHVLLEHFFDKLESSNSSFNHRSKPPHDEHLVVCPNRLAAHPRNHRMDKVSIKYNSDGSFVGTGRCACGISIRFSRFKRNTHEPEIDRFFDCGESLRNTVLKMRDDGASIERISNRLDVPKTKIENIIYDDTACAKRLRSHAGVSSRYIQSLRQEWKDILSSVDGKRVSLAKQRSPQIYEILKARDARWLQKLRKQRALVRITDQWRTRDKRSVLSLTAAKEQILAAVPPVRASRSEIARKAAVSWAQLNGGRMPLAAATLKQLEEPVEEFRIRRIHFTSDNMIRKGVRLSRSRVLRSATLLERHVTPAIEHVISEILQQFLDESMKADDQVQEDPNTSLQRPRGAEIGQTP